jgi:hypothetical protein
MDKSEKLPISIDPRWQVFEHTATIEEFETHYLSIGSLDQDLGNMVKDYERLTGQLLRLSYFEYELITVALKHTFVMAELALKLLYKKKYAKESRKNLLGLIAHFYDSSLIDQQDFIFWESVRLIRNEFTHPYTYPIHPPSSINMIRQTIAGINKLNVKINLKAV